MNLVRSLGMVIAALALIAGCGGSVSGSPQPGAVPAASAAGEQLRFTAQTVGNEPFSGQSLIGKPAVLWFWTPWCPTCRREAPGVADVALANPGVTFVGVAAQDQVPAMRGFVSRYGVGSFTHLADLNGQVWQRFGVTAQPAYAFLGADGSVQVVKGSLTEPELAERVHALAGA